MYIFLERWVTMLRGWLLLMCAEGPWFASGYGRGDGLKLHCYTLTSLSLPSLNEERNCALTSRQVTRDTSQYLTSIHVEMWRLRNMDECLILMWDWELVAGRLFCLTDQVPLQRLVTCLPRASVKQILPQYTSALNSAAQEFMTERYKQKLPIPYLCTFLFDLFI